MRILTITTALAWSVLATAAHAQFGDAESGNGPKLLPAEVHHFQVGMKVTAVGGPCGDIRGTIAVPTDWPEQIVRISSEDITAGAQYDFRVLRDGVKQMLIYIPHVPAGEEARALLTLEIERRPSQSPADPSKLLVPEKKQLPRDMLIYLANSPRIETTQRQIKDFARELTQDKETAWEKVQAIYDWVRANVTQQEGGNSSAVNVLKNRVGDHEDMTNLFVALCRASGVPSRIVWVPKHCYPEFYLIDAEERGYWFPCDLIGEPLFGGTVEARPILQKGDNHRTPDRPREAQRFVAEHVQAKSAGGKPRVRFVRKPVDDPDEDLEYMP